MAYKVAKGFSVIYQGRHLMPGDEVPGGLRSLPELVKSGHVTKTEAEDGSAESEPKDYSEPPMLKPESVVTDAGAPPPVFSAKTGAGIISGAVVPKEAASTPILDALDKALAPAPKAQPVGKWNVDPSTLKGKDLQQLNVMVLERDGGIKPFDTIEEAIAQLSLDFKA